MRRGGWEEPICRRCEFGDQDSNLNKQYQKLLCYRYTIPESAIAAL